MQMGKDANINLVRIDTQLAEFIRTVEAILLLTRVVILGRPLSVRQAGIHHDLVLASVYVETEHRDLDLLSRLALEKHVGTEVSLTPTGIDGINLGLIY
jgi:hypothetical protein